jgi:hypothetical protein
MLGAGHRCGSPRTGFGVIAAGATLPHQLDHKLRDADQLLPRALLRLADGLPPGPGLVCGARISGHSSTGGSNIAYCHRDTTEAIT